MKSIARIIRQHRNQATSIKTGAACAQSQCNYDNNYYGDQVCGPCVTTGQQASRT